MEKKKEEFVAFASSVAVLTKLPPSGEAIDSIRAGVGVMFAETSRGVW